MKRIGVIDLGTNTFNLLIVDRKENGFIKVYSTKEGVGLGLGGINKGLITDDAIQRGVDTLRRFLKKCDELNVVNVKAIATSAVRDAKNKDDFMALVEAELQLEIEVVSGEREAQLIHQGVSLGYVFESPSLIMDIGGGSTEFIYATLDKVIKSKSFNIGTSRMYELFDFQDPLTNLDVVKVVDYLEKNTSGFFDDIEVEVLIGASGSFETFYALLNEREYPEDQFENLDSDVVLKVLDSIIYSTLKDRMENELIIPIRKKLVPIAAIKIKWVLEKLNCKTLTISPFALKEGLIEIV